MIEVRERTRSGCSSAIVCTIMPPIEMPDHVRARRGRDGRAGRTRPRPCRRGCTAGDRRGPGSSHEHPAVDPALRTRRAAGVAVVVADHEEPAVGEHPAERRVPPGHRASEPHHQQQRLRRRVAERLVAELHAAGQGRELLVGGAVGDAALVCDEVRDIGPFVRAGYPRVYATLVRGDPKVTVRSRYAYFAADVVTVTSWFPRWGRSCARPASPGPRACARSPGRAARCPRRPASSPRSAQDRLQRRSTPYAMRAPEHGLEPVVLVPGFMAGDGTLGLMSRHLRGLGYRTYRSTMHANVGCTRGGRRRSNAASR